MAAENQIHSLVTFVKDAEISMEDQTEHIVEQSNLPTVSAEYTISFFSVTLVMQHEHRRKRRNTV